MAMLAEPRRRSKYSVDPRNLNWSNDESKFGQKLMEKFGWSKGRGLGAKEDGRTENITVSTRSDNRGVGCSKQYEDNWIAHQDDFNSLLASLNSQNEAGANSTPESTHIVQVLSLEQRSKKTKRVHYGKFTRGKDLSRAGAEDMDCIFGRRKSRSTPSTPLDMSENNSENEDSDHMGSEQTQHGVTTIDTGTSVQAYFAKKMAELRKVSAPAACTDNQGSDCDNPKQEAAKLDFSPHNIYDDTSISLPTEDGNNVSQHTSLISSVGSGQLHKSSKNKNSKKRKFENIKDESVDILDLNSVAVEEMAGGKKKKSKKNKLEDRVECNADDKLIHNASDNTPGKITQDRDEETQFKSSTGLHRDINSDMSSNGEQSAKVSAMSLPTDEVTEVSQETLLPLSAVREELQKSPKKKKSKKRKRDRYVENPDSNTIAEKEEPTGEESGSKKKKSKKHKDKMKSHADDPPLDNASHITPDETTHNKEEETQSKHDQGSGSDDNNDIPSNQDQTAEVASSSGSKESHKSSKKKSKKRKIDKDPEQSPTSNSAIEKQKLSSKSNKSTKKTNKSKKQKPANNPEYVAQVSKQIKGKFNGANIASIIGYGGGITLRPVSMATKKKKSVNNKRTAAVNEKKE